MRIVAVHVRRFRSIRQSAISGCGGLNVLIGKNNSGKSNFLSAIDLVQRHLRRGGVSGPWSTPKAIDEFSDRDSSAPIQIGVEFEASPTAPSGLRQRLDEAFPHLKKSIEQIGPQMKVAIVVAAVRTPDGMAFLFVQRLGLGSIVDADSELAVDGTNLLTVPSSVGLELFEPLLVS